MAKTKVSRTVSQYLATFDQLINDMRGDAEKFDKGVNAAGARLRKAAQLLKVTAQTLRHVVTAQTLRNDVTEIKHSR